MLSPTTEKPAEIKEGLGASEKLVALLCERELDLFANSEDDDDAAFAFFSSLRLIT